MNDDENGVNMFDGEGEIIEPQASVFEKSLMFIIAAFILLTDLLTKLAIENSLAINESYEPIKGIASFFKITYVTNTGASFGIFPSGSQIIMVVSIIVAIVIVIYNFRLPAHHMLFRFALGLQLGGALGNLLSRFRIGYVTDFLDFGPWPVFNIADLSIVTGVILLGYLMIFEKQEVEPDQEEESQTEQADSQQAESNDDSMMLWND